MSDQENIVGIGELLWDCLPEGRKLGGAPGNFAYHVGQFGLHSCVVSAIGGDDLGREIERQLAERHLSSRVATVDFPTGTVEVQIDDNGIPIYDIRQNVAWDNIPFTPEIEALARRTRAVCFGSLAQRSATSRNTIAKFLDAMPDNDDSLRIFDINLRQKFYTRDTLEASFRRCNVLKINDEELVAIARLFNIGGTCLEPKCEELVEKYHLSMLILTCGTNGSYVFTANGRSFIATPHVAVADTVGAGDSFTAAILKGKDVNTAHRLAVDVSAFVCTQAGAMPILPQELRERI